MNTLQNASDAELLAQIDASNSQKALAQEELGKRRNFQDWTKRLVGFADNIISTIQAERAKPESEREESICITYHGFGAPPDNIQETPDYGPILRAIECAMKVTITTSNIPMKGRGYWETDPHLEIHINLTQRRLDDERQQVLDEVLAKINAL